MSILPGRVVEFRGGYFININSLVQLGFGGRWAKWLVIARGARASCVSAATRMVALHQQKLRPLLGEGYSDGRNDVDSERWTLDALKALHRSLLTANRISHLFSIVQLRRGRSHPRTVDCSCVGRWGGKVQNRPYLRLDCSS